MVNPRDDRALRVLADHGRGMTFLATDGVRPGNEGRDYILRRVIRRAMAEGSSIGLTPEAMPALAGQVADLWGDAYPELRERASEVGDIIGAEAEQFARTLTQGKRLLDDVIGRSKGQVSGDDAFRLHDTFGFPLDLTLDAAEVAGLAVDTEGFNRLMTDQRERAREAQIREHDTAASKAEALAVAGEVTEFVGYDEWSVTTTVTAADDVGDGEVVLKLARSPFYAQGGGQVSDRGTVTGPTGSGEVVEIYRIGDDQVVKLRVEGQIAPGDQVQATVHAPTRRATQANHTATHVLHWALREVFGTTTRQAGSYVGPDKLRFDFSLRERMSEEQRAQIEQMVNDRVAEDTPVGWQVMARAEADASGAIGLFGEKYGDRVRVVSAGDFSKELCGGTHVSRTGEIGAFKIVSEGGIGSGTRRIEALTGDGVVAWYQERERELEARLADRDDKIRQLEGELKRVRSGRIDAGAIAAQATDVGGLMVLVHEVEASEMDDLLTISDQIKSRLGDAAAIVLGARSDGKAMLVASLASGAIAAGLNAGAIIKQIAPLVDGAGGGRDGMARAGGKNPQGLDAALRAARTLIAERGA